MWYTCNECVFATNSPKGSVQHSNSTDHKLTGEKN